jgi:hypothetical protein
MRRRASASSGAPASIQAHSGHPCRAHLIVEVLLFCSQLDDGLRGLAPGLQAGGQALGGIGFAFLPLALLSRLLQGRAPRRWASSQGLLHSVQLLLPLALLVLLLQQPVVQQEAYHTAPSDDAPKVRHFYARRSRAIYPLMGMV